MTGIHFKPDPNYFHALTSKDACSLLSGAVKGLAANMMKIVNDVRFLASGTALRNWRTGNSSQ